MTHGLSWAVLMFNELLPRVDIDAQAGTYYIFIGVWGGLAAAFSGQCEPQVTLDPDDGARAGSVRAEGANVMEIRALVPDVCRPSADH